MMNPFTPSFGEVPSVFAGRSDLLRIVERALDTENRSPELTLLLSGARGTGKTVLLARIAELAQERGWVSVNVTTGTGMLEEVYARSLRAGKHILPVASDKRLTSVGIGQLLEMSWENERSSAATWRERMEDVVDMLNSEGVGLLITVDEVLPEVSDMVRLASVYQHFVRERKKVALMMAGLPFNIDGLLDDKTVSFLRRAQRCNIGRVPDFEVADALRKTARQGGRSIEGAALEHAVDAIAGFPYMIQLAGYRMWEVDPQAETICLDDAVTGCAFAMRELRERVVVSTYRELSDGDIAFLEAMLLDEKDTTLRDIEKRLGKSSGYVNTYRRRLLAAGVVGERRRGVIGFDLPGFREFLQEELGR